MVAGMLGAATKMETADGGGSTAMDVDREQLDDDPNYASKGTKRAKFYNIILKGARQTKLHGRKANGGGSNATKSTLKTTMKKTSNPRKKLGIYTARGPNPKAREEN